MKYFKSLVLLIMVLLTSPAFAQREADSLQFQAFRDSIVQVLNQRYAEQGLEMGRELLDRATEKQFYFFMIEGHMQKFRAFNMLLEGDSSINAMKQAIKIATEQKLYKSLVACSSNLALAFFAGSQYDSAQYYYRESVRVAREYVPNRVAIGLSNLAWINGVIDDREKEFEYYLASLKALEEYPDSFRKVGVKAMTLGGIGDYYLYTKEYEKARDFFEQKLALGKEVGDLGIQYEASSGLGTLYRQDEFYDFEKSKSYYEPAVANEEPGFGHYRYQSMQALAKLYRKDGQYEQAIKYFREVYDFYHGLGVDDFSASAATALGEMYLEINRLNEADRWLNIALEDTKPNKLIARERDVLRNLYKVDSLKGQYRASLGKYQRFKQIQDSLLSERSQNRIKELEIQYETEQTEKENVLLKSDLELKEAQVARQQIFQVLVAVVALTFIIVALIVYRNFQRKKKDHETIALQADELKTLSRFKQGLTSMVVHDMRNPLNAILGFSQGTPTDDKLRRINRSGHQVLNLVNNMLDIQRFEEAKVELNTEEVSARQLVANAIREVSLLTASKSLRIANLIPEALNYQIDEVLVNRILVNLLINSVKYSKSGTEITVEVGAAEGGFQELVVTDKGHGIPADQLPYIFNKFWHNDPERSGVLPSTGLGLSFCKLAVEAHGGSIRAESILHEGTSMYLSLPLADQPVVAAEVVVKQNGHASMISKEDAGIYVRFLPDLEKLQVFEVSEINKLIKSIEALVSDKGIGSRLRTAAFQGDQGLYDELLDQIRRGSAA